MSREDLWKCIYILYDFRRVFYRRFWDVSIAAGRPLEDLLFIKDFLKFSYLKITILKVYCRRSPGGTINIYHLLCLTLSEMPFKPAWGWFVFWFYSGYIEENIGILKKIRLALIIFIVNMDCSVFDLICVDRFLSLNRIPIACKKHRLMIKEYWLLE